ncbi:reverse transcriptase family protein [Vibrio sp. 10N.222.54.A1]|uniref:reverse transcriptase family protein n=1 Tax=unclassified Vibrio TaxID=2614977 RepID=UPI0035527F59
MQTSNPEWTEVSSGMWELPVPKSYLIDNQEEARWLFFDQEPVMRVKQISVKSGHKTRPIFAPDDFSKSLYRQRLKELYTIFSEIESQTVSYGFVPQRSVVDQAKCHIGYQYTISLDIRDFFDSIRPKLVKGLIPNEMISMLFIDGAPRQGLPTSPIVANIAFDKIDREIIEFLLSIEGLSHTSKWFLGPLPFTYTRYADDLSISLNENSIANRVINGIQRILLKYGFELHPNKTKVLSAHNGRRVICGVGVDKKEIYPTRKTLRKVRAATHQSNFHSLLGLRSWVSSIEKKQSI